MCFLYIIKKIVIKKKSDVGVEEVEERGNNLLKYKTQEQMI